MSEERVMQTRPLARDEATRADDDTGVPVTSVRLLYPDLHGVARGKDVPISEFDHAIENGLCFCSAVVGTDLRHTPVVGG
jgi:glutamine synthetase